MINKMKFRQRIAWLVVAAYLGGTFSFFYYMFEINEHYNQFAVDHVQKYHSTNNGNTESRTLFSAIWGHLTDIPLPLWLLVFLLPYLQIFMMILACTRVEPKHSIAYLWPGIRSKYIFLSEHQMRILSEHQMRILSEHQMRILSEHQMRILSEHQMRILSEHQMRILSEHQMQNLSEHQMCSSSEWHSYLSKYENRK